MPGFDASGIRVVLFDIFGTTVDWYTGIADQATEIAREAGVSIDGGAFAATWRERYLPSMRRVTNGERDWAYLDTLHRESLDDLLETLGYADTFDEAARRRLVHAWHRLPAWADSVEGLHRMRRHFTTAALSNGGFALLTELSKAASLPFDCILSAELAHSYKPAASVYLTAVGLLDVAPSEALMVACHHWDLDGARAAGLHTAFVERPREKGPHTAVDKADDADEVTAITFTELADALGC